MSTDPVVPEDVVLEACGETDLPAMGVIEQVWDTDPIPREAIADRAAAAARDLEWDGVPDGGEVALGVGSRGINNLPSIVRGVVEGVRDLGYDPFVFPAMGSHGGATAAGQREKLASYDVTGDAIDCEIRSSMDVELVAETPERGVPVHVDAHAAAADAIVPINRIKPHTDFDGAVESGLSKMLVIGMGKQRGAKTAHAWAIDWSFRNMLPEIASGMLDALPIVGGVAVVEDQHDDTAIVEGIPPSGFLDREAELLETAYEIMPTLPFEELDVLVLDRIGKDISGTGMDTNVVGRRPFAINEPEPETPDIKRIFARSVTAHGNALGVGSADLVHRDLYDDLDAGKTLINALTASTVRSARLPPVVETDRAGFVAALSTIGVVAAGDPKVLRATDTMRLQRLHASETLVEAARDRDGLRVVAEPEPVEFEDGRFVAESPSLVTH